MSSDKGIVSKGLVLVWRTEKQPSGYVKRNHRGEKLAIKGFSIRSRREASCLSFFGRSYQPWRESRSLRRSMCPGEIPQQPPMIPAPAAAQRSA